MGSDPARLWTARVAGDPVKPVVGPGGLRIPLVKTAEGDQDYAVELKYGGRMDRLGRWNKVRFPVMHTANINVEESQVRLWLPESHRWFDFGGSMRLTREEGDLLAGYYKYQSDLLRRTTESLKSGNAFAKLRASNNLKQITQSLEELNLPSAQFENERLLLEYTSNVGVVRKAKELLNEQQRDAAKDADGTDNRVRLNEAFDAQSNDVSLNTVNSLALDNFDMPSDDSQEAAEEDNDGDGIIAGGWLQDNGLNSRTTEAVRQRQSRLDLGKSMRKGAAKKTSPVERFRQVPSIAGKDAIDNLKQNAATEDEKADAYRGRAAGRKLQRFEQSLKEAEQQQAATGMMGGMGMGMGGAAGGAQGPQSGFGMDFDESIDRAPGAAGAAAPPPATGLASLDVQLPTRGVEYLFTSPRGDVEIIARAIDQPLVSRGIRLSWISIGLVVCVALYRQLR